ncbi:B12-binding domain-containing radical SAM protein [candidate division KSB3 bacterium]|uniref:B12-binding domain-containing radical SAM protein n=1 Tax=candidate division KSB3 bacterium TaxID=2044937 RepID=A0A2G6KH76_9BACT|nr:MAG: B12-binding domain-containing radical SAM protein [candidate division KSB3 bacterium]
MTSKLLLLQPPVQDFYDTTIRLQPIGLAYLKAAVHKHLPEFQVVVKDYHHGHGKRTIPLPEELVYLRDYYAYPDKSPFCAFYQYYHFGASFEDIAKDVAAEQPDLVGISSLFSAYSREVIACAKAMKTRLNVPILVGGSHVSADPTRMLQHACIDFVICGEGERPFVEFLRVWQNRGRYESVPNLGFKRDNKIVINSNAPNYPIDELPHPDFSDFPVKRYVFERRPLCFLVTSRGCPHHCAFCSVHVTFGAAYRRRSNALILEELRHRYDEGYRVFDFEDDNLTYEMAAMKELCQCIIDEFPQGELQFLAMNGLSYQHLDAELLHLMKTAGFSHLNLSLVSADRQTRSRNRRPHSLEQYVSVVQKGAEFGFKIVSYQILGLPGESLSSMIDTLVTNIQLPVLLGASMLYVTPNMPIIKRFPALVKTDSFVSSRLTSMAIETEHLSRDELFTLFITTRILNFLKGLDVIEESCSLVEALHIAEKDGGRAAIGSEILRQLFAQRQLFAMVGKELKPIRRFQAELFVTIWSKLQGVCTQQGHIIHDLQRAFSL